MFTNSVENRIFKIQVLLKFLNIQYTVSHVIFSAEKKEAIPIAAWRNASKK